jgi:uncharacterized protein
MRLLRAADHQRMPWKNGLGETTEIAVHPERADMASFDWRVSMATVAADGPFSAFPGIDRTLSILDGEGIDLSVEGYRETRLRGDSLPHSFPADVAVSARLIAGPITDLNVMTRRGRFEHDVSRLAIEGDLTLTLGAETILFICHHGQVEVSARYQSLSLGPLDAIVTGGGTFTLKTTVQASLFIVAIGYVM